MPQALLVKVTEHSQRCPEIRSIYEDMEHIFRGKVQSPKWIEGLKPHGSRGAEEISNLAEYVFAWDAISGTIDPWMYQGIAEMLLFDKESSERLRDANPYAMHEIISRLPEAAGRGMREPDDETIYLTLRGRSRRGSEGPKHTTCRMVLFTPFRSSSACRLRFRPRGLRMTLAY